MSYRCWINKNVWFFMIMVMSIMFMVMIVIVVMVVDMGFMMMFNRFIVNSRGKL